MMYSLCNLIFGVPLVGHFGGVGALLPYELSKGALDAVVEFCNALGILLKTKQADVGRWVIFLGLLGASLRPANEMDRTSRYHRRMLELGPRRRGAS